MSNDTAECGCEGYVSNFEECKYPALLAREAALEAEIDRLSKEGTAALDHLQERLKGEEDGNRELVRRAQQAEAQRDALTKECAKAGRVEAVLTEQVERYRSETEKLEHQRLHMAAEIIRLREVNATLSAAGQVLSEHVDNVADTRLPSNDHPHFGAYPCSPTCTHDDAATPGHAERVRERSEAVKEAVSQEDHTDGILTAAFSGYDDGAEAMRAACMEVVMNLLGDEGLGAFRLRFKSAIEGAAP